MHAFDPLQPLAIEVALVALGLGRSTLRKKLRVWDGTSGSNEEQQHRRGHATQKTPFHFRPPLNFASRLAGL
jgi:hypothetical protein